MPVKIDGTGYIGTANNIYTNSSGYVGVGTASPSGKLSIAAPGADGLVMEKDANSTGNSGRMFFLADGTNFAMCATANTLSFFSGSIPGNSTGTQRLIIDSSGRVAIPAQPTFFAFAGSTQVASNVAQFTTTLVNVGSYYNTTTYRFTAPVAGNYGFNVFALKDNVNTDTTLQFRKNGTVVGNTADGTGSAYLNLAMNIVLPLAIGDYVDVLLGVGGIYNGYRGFSGWLIG